MTVLYVDAGILREGSVSRQLSAAVVAADQRKAAIAVATAAAARLVA